MKQLIVLVLLSLVALTVQTSKYEERIKIHGECVSETKANEAEVVKILKNEEITDTNTKCYFLCSLKKVKDINDAGVIHLKSARDEMPDWADQTKYIAILEQCEKVTGSDSCDTAYQVAKCLKSKIWPKQ